MDLIEDEVLASILSLILILKLLLLEGLRTISIDLGKSVYLESSLTHYNPLQLIQEGRLSVSGERMCTILVNRSED